MRLKLFIGVGIFVLAVSPCSKATAVVVVFSDDFNSGASPLWGHEVGDWSDVGGVYRETNGPLQPQTQLNYSSLPFKVTDFSVDVDVNDINDGGIWLRSQDNKNGVLLVTGGNGGTASGGGGDALYWHVVKNGVDVAPLNMIAKNLFTPGISDPHLRIDVVGDLYSVFIDGSITPATSITTSEFASGRVGLYDFSFSQSFDNFVLSVPDGSVGTVPEPTSIVIWTIGALTAIALSTFRRSTRRPRRWLLDCIEQVVPRSP